VVVRADLSGLENEIAVLSGRTKNIKLLDTVRKTVGDDPSDWLPLFIEGVRKNNNSSNNSITTTNNEKEVVQ
jgi:type IV secretion system protein VirB4